MVLPAQEVWALRLQLVRFLLRRLQGRCTRTTARARRSVMGAPQRRRCPGTHLRWPLTRQVELRLPVLPALLRLQQQAARRLPCRRCRWTCCASRCRTTSTSTRRPAIFRWATPLLGASAADKNAGASVFAQ